MPCTPRRFSFRPISHAERLRTPPCHGPRAGHGAKLIIVHVEEPPAAYGTGEMYYGIPDPDMPALNKMLEAVVPSDTAVPFEHRMITGDPAGEIVALPRRKRST